MPFFFLHQNIGCGYSKEPSQEDGSRLSRWVKKMKIIKILSLLITNEDIKVIVTIICSSYFDVVLPDRKQKIAYIANACGHHQKLTINTINEQNKKNR